MKDRKRLKILGFRAMTHTVSVFKNNFSDEFLVNSGIFPSQKLFVYSKSVPHEWRLVCQYDSLIKTILSAGTNWGFFCRRLSTIPICPKWLQMWLWTELKPSPPKSQPAKFHIFTSNGLGADGKLFQVVLFKTSLWNALFLEFFFSSLLQMNSKIGFWAAQLSSVMFINVTASLKMSTIGVLTDVFPQGQ